MPNAGAKGPVNVGLPQPIGVYAITPLTEIAPAVVKALPSNVSLALMVMAALLVMIVPRMVTFVAKLVKPSIFQNTLHANAPFINFTLAFAAAEKAPCNLNINTAFGFPCAFNVSMPDKVEAPVTE